MVTALKALLSAGFVGIGLNAAHAQAPQRTTATYDDWTVSCVIAPGLGGTKTCEMTQSQAMQGQTNPVSQITINRPAKDGPFRIYFQVPANIWLLTGVKFKVDDKDPGLIATFKWCVPARCLSDADLTDVMLKNLRALKEPARLEFKDALQRDFAIPVSFKGFGQSLDVLVKD